MKIKKIVEMFFVVIMCLGIFPLTAFAYVEEPEPTAETATGETTAEETENTENDDVGVPLTPDGNMNLVDDIGSSSGSGKQFIAFTTKNGNYLYNR